MGSEIDLSKAKILIRQGKFDKAERILKHVLSVDGNHIEALIFLAEVYFQQEKLNKSLDLVNQSIGLNPENPRAFYIKSRIFYWYSNLEEAEKFIRQSIRLHPYNAIYFSLLANIQTSQKKFKQALENANQALDIDPENLYALNVRSLALIKLNKKKDAFESYKVALCEEPNNANTHANYAWSLLEKDSHKLALDHFKEALRIDPENKRAQVGVLEAIKAKKLIYRVFLKYRFFMDKQPIIIRVIAFIVLYIIFGLFGSLEEYDAALKPLSEMVTILLAVIIFSFWSFRPVSDLFLLFSPYKQLLLSNTEKFRSNLRDFQICSMTAGLLFFFLGGNEKFIALCIFGFAITSCFNKMLDFKHKASTIFVLALAAMGLVAVVIIFFTGQFFNPLFFIFIFASIIYCSLTPSAH